jgi:pimeloyl-ACP methyl ester carboxylesterase
MTGAVRRARRACATMAGMPTSSRARRRAAPLSLMAAVTAASLSAAGCSASGAAARSQDAAAAPAAASPRSALHWAPCTVSGTRMDCAMLKVPLNYRDPGGRTITLALSMVPATAPPGKRQGVLLVNPGGPGASGRALAAAVAGGLSPSVAASYTIIGFDPRGVGASVPALHCDRNFFSGVRPDYIPSSAAAEQAMENRAKEYAADCEKKFGWLLPYMTTEDTARDMNSIRVALHQQAISYYGFSYGTYIGEVYATLFPHRLRRMVLDSTVDPQGVWYADNISQDYAFQGRIDAFFAWVARYNGFYHLGSTAAQVQREWYAVRGRLESHPISGTAGPLIGPDEYDDTFLLGGYDDELWPGLAAALSSYARTGSAAGLIAQYKANGVQDENEFAVYNAVQCSDVNWPRNWATWNSDTWRVYKKAPFEAWDNAWYNAACAFWPVKGPSRPLRIQGKGLPGILMLQGTLDAATPYAGAQEAHRLLPSARMVVVQGGGNHGQSLESPPDSCVQNYLNSYLATGALPQHPGLVNATCPPVPDPTPNG